MLEKTDAVPLSTTNWGRMYFRNDEMATPHNHVMTYNALGAIQVAFWNRQGSPQGVQMFLRRYYNANGSGASYPTHYWAPTSLLQNGTWYRYEWQMEYVTATSYRIWPRVYDMAGTLLFDATHYRQSDYPSSGPHSLATWYAAGNTFGFSDVSLARRVGLGNEGPPSSPSNGQYWYHARLAISLGGWIGP